MMPSDCHIGWNDMQYSSSPESETYSSDLVCPEANAATDHSDGLHEAVNGSIDLQRNAAVEKQVLSESGWSHCPQHELFGEGKNYSDDGEPMNISSQSVLSPGQQRKSGKPDNASEQSWSLDMLLPSSEEAAVSDVGVKYSLEGYLNERVTCETVMNKRIVLLPDGSAECQNLSAHLSISEQVDNSECRNGGEQASGADCTARTTKFLSDHSINSEESKASLCASKFCDFDSRSSDNNSNTDFEQHIVDLRISDSCAQKTLDQNYNEDNFQKTADFISLQPDFHADADAASMSSDDVDSLFGIVSGAAMKDECDQLQANMTSDRESSGKRADCLPSSSLSIGSSIRLAHDQTENENNLTEPSVAHESFPVSTPSTNRPLLSNIDKGSLQEYENCIDSLPESNLVNHGVARNCDSNRTYFSQEHDDDSLTVPNSVQPEQGLSECCDEERAHSSSLSYMIVGPVSCVPDEILLKVFKYFTPQVLCRHVSAVCRRWHRLAYDSSLWRKLDMSCEKINGFQLCQIVLHTAGAIRYLDISGMEHLSTAEMAVVVENCPGLTHLDVGFVDDLNSTMMHALLTSCPNLQFINMEGCRNANNEMMRELAACAGPHLTMLNFSHCSLVDESLWLMMQRIHTLTYLNIDGISWISEIVVQNLASKYSNSLQSWEMDGNELTDNTIQSVSICHRLETLCISFCEHLTDQSLHFIQRLEHLQKLALRKGPNFTPTALTEFLKAPTLQNLTYLDLSECQQLDDDGVRAIAETCGTKLRTLYLSWCWDITDRGLEHVANTSLHMVKMYLVGLHRLEGSWLPTAVDTMPSLIYISFEQCNEVTDTVIEEAVRDKADLIILNYYGEVFMHQFDSL